MPKLYIIPTPIAEEAMYSINTYTTPVISAIKVWFVEELKTARRFLKAIDRNINIDELVLHVLNENQQESLTQAAMYLSKGDVGLLSEAGCPGVADPGAELVKIAQDLNIEVVPMVGPSSLLLALMASGMNGQQFKFNGYLPIKNPERSKALIQLEQESLRQNCTQLFIETPYRNKQMYADILQHLHPETRLCIAIDITGKKQLIKTKSIAEWRKHPIELDKLPCVFLIYKN